MSRIAKNSIKFSEGTNCSFDNGVLFAKGKLEGELEKNLRDPTTRNATVNALAMRITQALLNGISENEFFSPQPDGLDSVHQVWSLQTIAEDE